MKSEIMIMSYVVLFFYLFEQFCYGEDGRDVMKAQFLKKKQIPFLAENCKALKNFPVESLQDDETSTCIAKCKKKVIN
jgi:hypothetical protein